MVVRTETCAQMDKALAAGIHLTHIDTHMLTITLTPGMFKIYQEMSRRYHLPILIEKDGVPRP